MGNTASNRRHVRFSYLPQQFANPDDILEELRRFVPTGDFTLGKPVGEFEQRFAKTIGVKHAIGVGSGTDALKLSLKAHGVGYGDEVITAANTFIATVGAIAETGARPVFVDCEDTFCMNAEQIENAITENTKAIMPVHFTGHMADMTRVMEIAEQYKLPVIEDACQAILAELNGTRAGTWGAAAGFSLHPQKNLNVWADGGVVVTNDDAINDKIRLLRNHGLLNRDEIVTLGYNSRLDSVQAIVGNWLINSVNAIADQRIKHAAYLDAGLKDIAGIRIPPRPNNMKCVYHLYVVFAENRDGLLEYCNENGIEAKIHYPIPLYQQEGLKHFGYKAGDFPVTDRHSLDCITFPADEHLETEHLDYVIETVREFYAQQA